jgi:uncharacterized protein (TIGR03382 family)
MSSSELRRALPVLTLTFVLGACVGDEDVGKLDQALAHDGPWDIPAETIAIGDSQYVTYTGAGPWVGSSGCGGGLSEGAAILREWLRVAYPQISSIGGYSCRSINGDGTTMSVHATGRALDVMIPTSGGAADNDLGDPIGTWLIEHAEEIGIQYIIWDRWTWGAHRAAGSKERAYGGAHPHHDHLHVELSVEASRLGTPWFSGPMTLPQSDCIALGPDGGVIEETDDCFAAYGPSAYWRHESSGHGGGLMWTNAFQSDSPSNWARWHLDTEEAGRYAVEVWAEPGFAVHRATRYQIAHAGEEHELEVDLSGASGWVRLAELDFAAGSGQHLSVYDNTSSPVAADQHVPADAVQLVRLDGTTPEPMPIEPMPGARTNWMFPVERVAPPPILGGDPTIDDDGFEDHFEEGTPLSSGCSASGAHPPVGGAPLLLFLGFSLGCLLRRRR